MTLSKNAVRRTREGHIFDWCLENGGYCVNCGIRAVVDLSTNAHTYTMMSGEVVPHPPPRCPHVSAHRVALAAKKARHKKKCKKQRP
jgi:hypothetical protein